MTASIFVIMSSSPVCVLHAYAASECSIQPRPAAKPTLPNNILLLHAGRDPAPALLLPPELATLWSHRPASESPASPRSPGPRQCLHQPADSAVDGSSLPAGQRPEHSPANL